MKTKMALLTTLSLGALTAQAQPISCPKNFSQSVNAQALVALPFHYNQVHNTMNYMGAWFLENDQNQWVIVLKNIPYQSGQDLNVTAENIMMRSHPVTEMSQSFPLLISSNDDSDNESNLDSKINDLELCTYQTLGLKKVSMVAIPLNEEFETDTPAQNGIRSVKSAKSQKRSIKALLSKYKLLSASI
jgi:hypothetical protein